MPRTVSSARHHSEVCLLDIHLFDEVCDFSFGLLFAIAVTLLHQTSQFIEAAADACKVMVCQFSTRLFRLAAYFFPFTCQYISIESYIHGYLLYLITKHNECFVQCSLYNSKRTLCC